MFANNNNIPPPCLDSVLVEDIPGRLGELLIPLVVLPSVLSQLVVNKDVVEVQLLLHLLGALPLLGESSDNIYQSEDSFSNVLTL